MRFFRSFKETHSSTLCIVLLTKPNSRHGAIFFMNLASDVPPVVERTGVILVIFFIITALLSTSGLDLTTSISAAATSISNVGPGLGDIIGPNGNFSNLSDFSKWILSLAMILGRLELFAVLVLFIPSFWRKY